MNIFPKKQLYFDHASATPLDRDVVRLMRSLERDFFANPSAIHDGGVRVRGVITEARQTIAALMHAHADEIFFTGSGTESDVLAILGSVQAYRGLPIQKGEKKPHIITTDIEHSAVLENCRLLEKNGEADVTYVSVNEHGIIDPRKIEDALRDATILVSVMYANNEIGTIQPITDIAKIIRHFRKEHRSRFPLFHTDSCQAINYLPTDNIEKLGVDLLSFNGSKIYGPKGIGVLYKKRDVVLAPLYRGGGQESGLRSGTENTASIVGTALAFRKACALKEKESARLVLLRDYGIKKLLALSIKSGYEIILNGDQSNRLPNNINISIMGISSELLVVELDAKGIAVSAKSACKSDEPDESHVIWALRKAQNIKNVTTDGSLRISLGRQTTKHDIDFLVVTLETILRKYRKWK
jgi:cysteine desulfurase